MSATLTMGYLKFIMFKNWFYQVKNWWNVLVMYFSNHKQCSLLFMVNNLGSAIFIKSCILHLTQYTKWGMINEKEIQVGKLSTSVFTMIDDSQCPIFFAVRYM